LFIDYEPQLVLHTSRIIGAEALFRWQYSVKGFISLAEFFQAAEANGTLIQLSSWLIREVCQQAIVWRKQGMAPLVIAVNCSAVQFCQSDLVSKVRLCMEHSGLPVKCLELELTESMLLQDS
jgi:EAL domain-containing protein (putative c-di-GMP-specific phosphodiesterase class I)